MRHHTAVHLPRDVETDRPEGWHYASTHRTGGYALGYCADHPPHPTETEARECYAQWQRDHIEFDRGTWSWTGCNAPDCDQPTKNAARVGTYMGSMASLCDAHLNTETAIKVLHLDRPAGDAWVS